MTNNKGQILPIFVILIPVLFIIISYIVDLGLMSIEKRRITNNIKSGITYYIDHIDDELVYEKTLDYLNKNISNSTININTDNEFIIISVKKDYKGIYSIININDSISITYKGNINDKRIIKG